MATKLKMLLPTMYLTQLKKWQHGQLLVSLSLGRPCQLHRDWSLADISVRSVPVDIRDTKKLGGGQEMCVLELMNWDISCASQWWGSET